MKYLDYNKSYSKLKNIFSERKHGITFLLYNLFGNGLALILNFLLPFFLTSIGYGYFALLYALYNLFTAIFTFGLDSTIIKYSLTNNEKINVIMLCLEVWLILSFFAFLLIVPLTWLFTIQNILQIPFQAAIITIFSAFLISFQRIMLYYYIANSNIKKYGLLFIFSKTIQFLSFLLVIYYSPESESIKLMPFLLLFQSIVTLVLILSLELRNMSLTMTSEKEKIKSMIKFTMPLSLETFGNIGYSYGFNLFISPFLSLSQIGTLNIYTQLGGIISMTSGALNNGYLPKFLKHIELDFKHTVKKYFIYILTNAIVITIGVFLISIFYKYLAIDTTTEFSIGLLFIYLLGISIYSFKAIGSSYLILQSKTMQIAFITILTSILNIITGIIVSNKWGFGGCIFSLSIGYVLQMCFFNFSTLKKYISKI